MPLISHRGAKGLSPENTLESIAVAAQLGVAYIEFDIQHTLDNQLVLFHNDKTLDGKHIAELSFEQLKQQYPDIALLKDALKACGKSTPLVEIKTLGTSKIALPILKTHQGVAVTSFISEEIIYLRKELPKAPAFIMQHKHPYGQIKKALTIKATGIGVNKNWAAMLPHYYWHARRSGLEVYTFTVNQSFLAAFFLRIMPHLLICTDYPDKLQKISTRLRFVNFIGLSITGLIVATLFGAIWHA